MMKFKIKLFTTACCLLCYVAAQAQIKNLKANFASPGNAYKPGVYWYFMDGNITQESVKRDLVSMKAAGIGSVLFLEVNVGIPQGKIEFLSDRWLSILSYMFSEAKRQGISISLGIGPGWQGAGGPWIKPEESMQTLVASETIVSAGERNAVVLPVPAEPKPYFGNDGLTAQMQQQRELYYKDVAVVAIPLNDAKPLKGYKEKALYYRGPFSSTDTVRPNIPMEELTGGTDGINTKDIIVLTQKMDSSGRLNWKPTRGKWKVLRFVSRNNGAVSRPAPLPGVGFESNKMDTAAIKKHLDIYVGKILKDYQFDTNAEGGLKALHIDSWESSSQNWTPAFIAEFKKRRGYDPVKYLPAFNGHVIGNTAVSERFLWDVRLTLQDMIFDNHASYVKRYAHNKGLKLSIEPYDLNQTSDIDLGSFADIPMAEFWSKGYGYNTAFSAAEASSIAHVNGNSVVQAESFTALPTEGWKQHPASMKDQGDWAFAAGINKFYFHTFTNQFLPDSLKPGATMGPFGVHWDSGQTWWSMVPAYHSYLSRCQYLLQQGRTVADILYLTPEGAPNVFLPPPSALTRDTIGDRKGFNFDGCTGTQLLKAFVRGNEIQFPGGASYKILVLPAIKTITPQLLIKIEELIKAGAIVIGQKPEISPSLVGYPQCDQQVKEIANRIWGSAPATTSVLNRTYGIGKIITGGQLLELDGGLYPHYDATSAVLAKMGFAEDFSTDAPVRYTHRTAADWDIYFCANSSDKPITFDARFRSAKGAPEVWNAIDGTIKPVKYFTQDAGSTTINLSLDAHESCFVVFSSDNKGTQNPGKLLTRTDAIKDLSTNWQVAFDTKWGGPAKIDFKELKDWSTMENQGIKYYSGIAVYTKVFDIDKAMYADKGNYYLNLGEVKNIARVKLNGKDLGVVWTAPWRVNISSALKQKNNVLEIEIANLWPNRMIGDAKLPYDGPQNGQWPDWLINGKPRPTKRHSFASNTVYDAKSKLLPSGLLGPVNIVQISGE
ncbi:glycosyl hydrolase [Mucilaginibacter sp. JRF]|uniref:glycosyl hydrolase n=1 Tax=Mucilaginibacter sp. JRF TaxID=2780088 RepID=UPI0018802E36|nr:glycosyl hydrolase [Mucilaginibacter sp. JRF]MBE9586644.1 glycosyl hydrolase [Mucilaginibacter sp. JRF]